jgi:DsbC/DsbD-like thiol-disulfide interchange protein
MGHCASMKRWLLLLIGLAVAGAQAAGPVVTTGEVRAELVAHAPEGVAPGKPVWLGLAIQHQPHWHTYWKNPGDSGLPTTLAWTLPAGAAAGEIAWPTPKRLPVGPLVNYGYEDMLLLPVPLAIAPGFKGSSLDVKLAAQWLVCKDVCIPQQGDFALSVPVQSTTAMHAVLFDAAQRAVPRDAPGAKASAELVNNAQALRVAIDGLPAALHGKALDFFAETAGVIEHAAQPAARWDGATWRADLAVSSQRFESPAQLHAVLTSTGEAAGVRVGFAIAGTWPAPTPPGPAAAAAPLPLPSQSPPPAPALGFGLALVFALIGGARGPARCWRAGRAAPCPGRASRTAATPARPAT